MAFQAGPRLSTFPKARTASIESARQSRECDAWGNAVDTTGSTSCYSHRGEQFDSDLGSTLTSVSIIDPR